MNDETNCLTTNVIVLPQTMATSGRDGITLGRFSIEMVRLPYRQQL